MNKCINTINYEKGQMNGVMGGGITPFHPFDPPGPVIPPGSAVTTLLTMDYCGNHIYRNGSLERTMNGYGYQADSTYYYYIKDYQGNVRAVIDQSGALKEINNYYPYGGLMGGAVTGIQPDKYGGKELDRENGIDWYDSQARMLDPMIGRTTTMDPMSENYYSNSPYNWCVNNPICNIDLHGDSIVYIEGINYTYKCINGVYGFYDSDNNPYSGTNPFVADLSEALATIREGKFGRFLVNSLMKSRNLLQIVRGQKNSSDFNGVSWNPNNTNGGMDTNGQTYRPSYIGLSHELGHVYDFWNDLTTGVWLSNLKKEDGSFRNIMNSDKYAISWENLIRSEHGIAMRKYYSINEDGTPFAPSRILNSDGSNRFYFLIELYSTPIFLPNSLKKIVHKK